MGSATSAPRPPDTSRFSEGQMNISETLQGMGAEMWDWAQGMQETMGANFEQFVGMAMPAAAEQFDWARNMRDKYETQVAPAIDSLFAEAELYASKGEEDRQRGAAIQDVKSATEAQRESQLRKLESYGIDPSETRYQSLDKQAGVAEAAMSALAANQAGERTKQIGRDLRADAIDVGTGFLTDAQNSYIAGANIGTSAINAGTATTQAGVAAGQGALPAYQAASNANAAGAGIVDTAYGREIDYAEDQRAAESADASGMGGLAGIAGAGLSFIPGMGAATAMLNAAAAEGGPVSAPGGPVSDGGAITISNGEYIVPADVVMKLGTNHFDKMIEKETGRPPPGMKQAIPVQGGG